MKLSSYYKSQGWEVELKLDYNNLEQYDKVTISKVFMDTEIPFEPEDKSFKTEQGIADFYKDNPILNMPNVEYGGTGFFYDKAPPLSADIEHVMPDYHLYDKWVEKQLTNGVKKKDLAYYTDYSIGFTCYDKDTEILTNEGWKLFEDLNKNELIATLNPQTFKLEYVKPYEYITYPYAGEMLHFKNKYTDLLVTPNHNMYINTFKKFRLMRADEVEKYYQYQFKKDAIWNGVEQSEFIFPNHKEDNRAKTRRSIDMDLWLEFLGYYLSEGTTQYKKKTRSYIVRIAQKQNGVHSKLKGDTYGKIKHCMNRMGYSFYENPNDGFRISNKQIFDYCKQFGLQPDRYVPDFIKWLSPRQIRIFLDAFLLGDGVIYKNSTSFTKGYITSSYKLASDIQELLLKVGVCGDIKIHTNIGDKATIGGRTVTAKHIGYYIFENNHYKTPYYFKRTNVVEHIKYDDNVYCVEVPNHIIYVRRNGIAVWCGNTRGCTRQCRFCVNQNYKKCSLHSPLSEFVDPNRPYICLLDDNIFACKDWRQVFDDINDTGKRFQFKQGCDERLMTDEKCEILFNQAKWIGDRIFAFDNIKDKDLIIDRLQMIRRHTDSVIKFYTFCGFNHNNIGVYDEEFWVNDIRDLFERIKILMSYGCLPYVMRYKDYELSPYRGMYIAITMWCNQPSFFKKSSFSDYCKIRGMSNENYKKYKTNFTQYLADGNKKGSTWRYMEEFAEKYPQIAKEYFNMKWEYSNKRPIKKVERSD